MRQMQMPSWSHAAHQWHWRTLYLLPLFPLMPLVLMPCLVLIPYLVLIPLVLMPLVLARQMGSSLRRTPPPQEPYLVRAATALTPWTAVCAAAMLVAAVLATVVPAAAATVAAAAMVAAAAVA